MNIDTLLQIFSSSFHILKNNIKSMAPAIILYGMGLITLLLYSNPSMTQSNDVLDIVLFTFIQALFKVFMIQYIFIHISNIEISRSSQNHILNISNIIQIFLPIFLLDLFISSISLLNNFSIFQQFSSILLVIYIIISCLFLFVPYIMIDKKETFKNSAIYSCVLTANNIGSILLFSVALILLLGILFIFLITIIFSIGQGNFFIIQLLLSSVLVAGFYYFILICFSLFYLKLSNPE